MKFCCKQIISHLGELTKNLNFSQYFFALIKIVKNIANEFNCVGLTGLNMLSPDNLAKTAFAQELVDLVLVGDVLPNSRQMYLVSVKESLVFHDYIFNYNHLIKNACFSINRNDINLYKS